MVRSDVRDRPGPHNSGATNLHIAARLQESGHYLAPLPPVTLGRWCLVWAGVPCQPDPPVVRLRPGLDLGDGAFGDEVFLAPLPFAGRGGRRGAILFLPAHARDVRCDLFGLPAVPDTLILHIHPLRRVLAALLLVALQPRMVVQAVRGRPWGVAGRLRSALAAAATGARQTASYACWIGFFDTWPAARMARLLASPRRPAWPDVTVLLFHQGESAALTASRQSLEQQALPHALFLIPTRDALHAALRHTPAGAVALLQAGEVLAPHALAVLADAMAMPGRPKAVYADEDRLSASGERIEPLFKPEPNHLMMLSGTLTRGVWMVQRALLDSFSASASVTAETLRLDVWLALHRNDPSAVTRRVPLVLTHRREDAQAASPADLAAIVREHVARAGLDMQVTPGFPLGLRVAAGSGRTKRVSLVTATTCRSAHALECLLAVLARTGVVDFELLLVICQPGPLDRQQQAVLRRLSQDSRVRHVLLPAARFNYAQANNFGVAQCGSELVCLLNDDVMPITDDWLAVMVGHMSDKRAGVVGAKLLYPNGTVQHGGIVLGVAGLCEHANRFLPGADPGYAWRGMLDQEVSAVTGACLLVRREIFTALGGLDEAYGSAYNDVDFCLRVREAGHGVVFAAQARLMHYESLSFGRHYARERAPLEAVDARRMRLRWMDPQAADPFHNPNLSLQRGNEWDLAFPPRVSAWV